MVPSLTDWTEQIPVPFTPSSILPAHCIAKQKRNQGFYVSVMGGGGRAGGAVLVILALLSKVLIDGHCIS